LVRSLLLVCTWAKFEPYAVEAFDNLARVRAVSTPEDFIQLLQLWIWSPAYTNAHLDELKEARAGAAQSVKDGTWMPRHAFDAQVSARNTHDTVARVGNIRVPTLLIVGTADVFTPPRYTEFLHDKIAGSDME